jgi:hypothetical protein
MGLEPDRYGIPIPMKIGIQLYSGFRVAARNGGFQPYAGMEISKIKVGFVSDSTHPTRPDKIT